MTRRVTRVIPILGVRNLDQATAYYRDALGFTIGWTWGEPAQRAGLVLDDIEIQVVAPGPGLPVGPAVVYCHMTGIDGYYAACRKAGARILMDLGERPWGVRDFRVLDPDGNQIGFAEPA